MGKKIFTALSIIAGISLFVFVLLKTGLDGIISSISMLSFWQFLIFIMFFFGEFGLHIYRWKMVLKIKGHDIPFTKLIPPRTAGYAVSYLTPLSRIGGEPVRAYLLKKEHELGFGEGLSSVFIDKIIEWTAAMSFLLVGMFFLFTYYALPKNTWIYLILIWVFLATLIFVFYRKAMRNEGFFMMLLKLFRIDRIAQVKKMHKSIEWFDSDISKFFINNKKKVFGLLLFSMFIQLIILIMYQLMVFFLGFKINLLYALLIMVFVSFATIIPTPATLGVYEGAAAVIFIILGLGAETGVAFSLLIRIAELTITGIGAFFLSFFGIKLSGTVADKNNQV